MPAVMTREEEEAAATLSNANLFSQTYNQIVSNALGNETPYFQMLGTPDTFSWPVAPTGQIDRQAYQIMSGMPLWSPLGNFGRADATTFDSYRQIFQHVTFNVSPSTQKSLNDAKDRATRANNDLTKAVSDANQAYLAQKQNGGIIFAEKYPTIDDWLDGPGASYMSAIDKAQKVFERAQDSVLELQLASMPTSLAEAMEAIKLPSGDPASSPAPRGWTKVADGSGILRWQPDWVIGQNSTDWRADLTKGSKGAFSVELLASDHQNTLDKSWAGASASYNAFFWGVSGSGGWQKTNITANDQSVVATVSVESSTVVKVDPGAWYDGGFMRQLARSEQSGSGYTIASPWVANGGKGSKSLFGQFGLLSTRVSGLLVAYKPSFSVQMKSSTYKKYHEKFEAGGGFRIGPFKFGGHGGHESGYEHSTRDGTTFEGRSTSEEPVILGVVVAFPGVDAPDPVRLRGRDRRALAHALRNRDPHTVRDAFRALRHGDPRPLGELLGR